MFQGFGEKTQRLCVFPVLDVGRNKSLWSSWKMKEWRAVFQASSHQRQARFIKIPPSQDHSSSGLFPKVVRTFFSPFQTKWFSHLCDDTIRENRSASQARAWFVTTHNSVATSLTRDWTLAAVKIQIELSAPYKWGKNVLTVWGWGLSKLISLSVWNFW